MLTIMTEVLVKRNIYAFYFHFQQILDFYKLEPNSSRASRINNFDCEIVIYKINGKQETDIRGKQGMNMLDIKKSKYQQAEAI